MRRRDYGYTVSTMKIKTVQLWAISLFFVSGSALAGSLNCRIEPHLITHISSPIDGLLSEIMVSENQEVTKGQILAKLDTGVEESTVNLRYTQAQMSSDIKARKLAVDFSQRNLKRVEDLYNNNAGSFAQVDEARTEYALAVQQLQEAKDRQEQAKLELARAKAVLDRRIITSPVDGLVINRYKQPGEHIADEPILQVAQLDPLKVEVFAPASLFGKIRNGMKAEIIPEIITSKASYQAEVVMVDKVIDAPSHTFRIRLSFPNPNYQLPSGLKCRVEFPDNILPSPAAAR